MITTTANDVFLAAYIEAALWSSTDESREDGGDPLDLNFEATDIAPLAKATMWRECRNFLEAMRAYIPEGMESQAGHDFWLTRNRHGAGFWDRPEIYGRDASQVLTSAAHATGGRLLYVGDDQRLHIDPA